MSRNHKGGRNRQNKNREKSENTEVFIDSPVLACFREYAKELDDKHDRYERVVKIGRDITIESKRIIFLLHTIDQRQNNREKVLEEAANRLKTVCETSFLQIARELDGLDENQYARAYSPGLQEFVEAYSFYEYLNNNSKLSDWDDLRKRLNYIIDVPDPDPKSESNDDEASSENVTKKEIHCAVKPVEFMLGLADLGGEIMRRCINSLGSGDTESCFDACKTLQSLYAGYLRNSRTGNREMPRKIRTLHESTRKAENVCYNIKVRGKEVVSFGTFDTNFGMDKMQHVEEDEGFF